MFNMQVTATIVEFWCPFCGASPGTWCTSARGTRVTYLHQLRFRKALYAGALPIQNDIEALYPHSDNRPDTRGV